MAYAAGLAEGALTVAGSRAQWRSQFETTFPNGTGDPLYVESKAFLLSNDAFMNSTCSGAVAASREQVCNVWAQFDGLVTGHAQAAAADGVAPISRLEFMFVNALVDLSSLIHKPFADGEWTAARAARHAKLTTHCSSIVRLSADMSKLWASHNTWSGYFTMLRVAKVYDLPSLLPAVGKGAAAVNFAGYYATLSSLDDFFVLSSGLVVQVPPPAPAVLCLLATVCLLTVTVPALACRRPQTRCSTNPWRRRSYRRRR